MAVRKKSSAPTVNRQAHKGSRTPVEERAKAADSLASDKYTESTSVNAFSQHIGVNVAEIRRIAGLGVLPDFATSSMTVMRVAFVDYLRKAASGQLVEDDGRIISIDIERAKLVKQKVIGEVRHNQTLAGGLVIKEDEADRLLSAVTAAKSILRGIPKIVRTKFQMSAEHAQEIGRIIDKALLAVAKEFGVDVDPAQYVDNISVRRGRVRKPYTKRTGTKAKPKRKTAASKQ